MSMKLRRKSPEVTSSIMERATWAITRALRAPPRPSDPPRPPPNRRVSARLNPVPRKAGRIPNRGTRKREMPNANITTVESTPISSRRGTEAGPKDRRKRPPTEAIPKPSTPPMEARTRFSTRSCRSTRPLPAPRAKRVASSVLLVLARARVRDATLAQATKGTRETIPMRMRRTGLMLPKNTTCSGCSQWDHSAKSGLASWIRRDTASTWLWAWARETPSRSRPTMKKLLLPRPVA